MKYILLMSLMMQSVSSAMAENSLNLKVELTGNLSSSEQSYAISLLVNKGYQIVAHDEAEYTLVAHKFFGRINEWKTTLVQFNFGLYPKNEATFKFNEFYCGDDSSSGRRVSRVYFKRIKNAISQLPNAEEFNPNHRSDWRGFCGF